MIAAPRDALYHSHIIVHLTYKLDGMEIVWRGVQYVSGGDP